MIPVSTLFVSAIAVTALLQSEQQEADRDDAGNSELSQYQKILSNSGISPDATGAARFLRGLIPDDSTDREISELIRKLASSRYLEREKAERQLTARGTSALALLKRAARDGDTETRMRSTRCISAIQDRHPLIINAAVATLILDTSAGMPSDERLNTLFELIRRDHELAFQYNLISSVREIARPINQKLIMEGLESQNQYIRKACVRSLTKCLSFDEMKEFSFLIRDEDPHIALAAVEFFGELLPEVSVKRLLEFLDSNDTNVRREAVIILRSIAGEYFEFFEEDPVEKRNQAIVRWRRWAAENRELLKKNFVNLRRQSSRKPTGFLVSVANTRLIEFSLAGKEVWQHPVSLYDAQFCSANRFLVTERNPGQVRLIDRKGNTKWLINGLRQPSDAELLINGNILVLQGNGVATEHKQSGEVVREFKGLQNPFDVDRLPNGNTLAADSGNNRLVEFDAGGRVVWEKPGLSFPNNVYRLSDGRTLYTTYTSGDVVMLDVSGNEKWRTQLDGGTLYAVYAAGDRIYVADGKASKIWILDMGGRKI